MTKGGTPFIYIKYNLMRTTDCTFQKHKGSHNSKTDEVCFYGLVFTGIVQAISFLKDMKPGAYTPWVHGKMYGVYDPEEDWYYTIERGWVPDVVHKMLLKNYNDRYG